MALPWFLLLLDNSFPLATCALLFTSRTIKVAVILPPLTYSGVCLMLSSQSLGWTLKHSFLFRHT